MRAKAARGGGATVSGEAFSSTATVPAPDPGRRRFLALAAGASLAGLAGCVRRPRADAPAMDAAAFHAARRYTRTAFGDIAHVERGSGPAALFLQGFPLN